MSQHQIRQRTAGQPAQANRASRNKWQVQRRTEGRRSVQRGRRTAAAGRGRATLSLQANKHKQLLSGSADWRCNIQGSKAIQSAQKLGQHNSGIFNASPSCWSRTVFCITNRKAMLTHIQNTSFLLLMTTLHLLNLPQYQSIHPAQPAADHCCHW